MARFREVDGPRSASSGARPGGLLCKRLYYLAEEEEGEEWRDTP